MKISENTTQEAKYADILSAGTMFSALQDAALYTIGIPALMLVAAGVRVLMAMVALAGVVVVVGVRAQLSLVLPP